MAPDTEILRRLYLGEWKVYSIELNELARLCCTRHDNRVTSSFTDGHAADIEIDAYYHEAARLGFEGSRVMWRRYVVGMREKV